MKIISVEEAEGQLDEVLGMTETDPIAIREGNGRTMVLLSMRQYNFQATQGYVTGGMC